MKADEKYLLLVLAAERPKQTATGQFATDLAEKLGIHPKRAMYILDKWTFKRGWWNYGVSLRAGWLTEDGLKAAKEQTP